MLYMIMTLIVKGVLEAKSSSESVNIETDDGGARMQAMTLPSYDSQLTDGVPAENYPAGAGAIPPAYVVARITV